MEQLMENNGFVAQITDTHNTQYCSFTPKTDDDKATLINAINTPDHRLADFINKKISVVHMYCESVQCVNEETGEFIDCPRIVLIDKDNVSYTCVSIGIFSSLKKIISIYGEPQTWKKPLTLEILQITKGKKQMLSLKIVK